VGVSLVDVERRGAVEVLRLNRPPVNALGRELLDALFHAAEEAGRDPSARAVVITGGTRAFSAGADVRELAELAEGGAREFIQHGQRVMDELARLNRPTVAAIEGYCLGGGLELALACHVRIAASGAELGLPEIKLGILPGFGGTQRLPRLVGSANALELMLTGDSIAPERALAIGLVSRVVASGEALQAAVELATRITERSATSAAAILRVYHGGIDPSFARDLGRELDEVEAALHSADGREGISAFLQKRAARFESQPSSLF